MKEKLPALFLERIAEILPKNEIDAFQASFEEDLRTSLRINLLKTGVEDFWNLFPGIEKNPIPWTPEGFFVSRKSLFTKTPFYHAGLFYIQEASSMLPVEILDPQPGERVLDICASPGSKTTQILSRMNNEGLLVANEIRRDRIGRLMENVSRWGSHITVVTNQSSRVFSGMENFFDKILIDAPCSGEGMFKKDPETLKYWSLQNIRTCSVTQKHILQDLSPALKVGGVMVYSTCTMAPEENEESIDWLLKTYPGCFEIEPISWGSPGLSSFKQTSYRPEIARSRRMWPHREETEGFFAAKIRKIAPLETAKYQKGQKIRKSAIQEPNRQLLRGFFKNLGLKFPVERCFQAGYHLYSWAGINPDPLLPYLPLLRPVYAGLLLGTEKKNRIEPEHALALGLNRPEEKKTVPSIELGEEEAVAYLRGQEIPFPAPFSKGFRLATYRGFPIGWIYFSQGRLKNFFPKNMRNKL